MKNQIAWARHITRAMDYKDGEDISEVELDLYNLACAIIADAEETSHDLNLEGWKVTEGENG